MSTRYNTGNPIESTDVRDMSDNAKNFDEFSNSMSDSFTDRFGVDRQTMEGAVRKAGFRPASFDFVTGGTLVSGDRNKAVFNPSPSGDDNWYAWQGELPKIISPNSTPETSGGFGENAWKPVTNNILAPTVRESIRRSYAEAGLNLVTGSFRAGFTLSKANDVALDDVSGKAYSGPAGTYPAGTSTTGFTDKSIISVAFTDIQVQQLLDSGCKVVQAYVPVLSSPVVVPQNATVVFNGVTRIALAGNVFTIVTGSRVYGDFIINAGFNPTIGYVDGTFRPTMLLSDNRRAGIYGTVRSESATPNGRALFLDANARNGKRGIISWFECDITLRNIARACDVEVSNPTGIDGAKSYINNNYLRITMWDVPYGYIEADIDLTKAEIAANDIHLDYQSNAVSVHIVRNRGTRNNLHGNIWDTDRSAYPSLLSNAVDIGGWSNVVGGANWPSSTSNVVVITDTLCQYTGYTYGTAKRLIKPLSVFSRIGIDQGNGVEAAVVGQLGAIGSPINIPAGAVLQSVFSRSYRFNSSRVPYFIDGYILLKNTTLSPVNVQVKFGPTSSDGALSSTFQIAAQRAKRVDLSLMISTLRQNATCGDGSWYGALNYSALTLHEVHVQVTSADGVAVDGLVLRRSSEL